MKEQEGWLAAAVSDVALAAEVLIRLKDSSFSAAAVNPLPPPTWGARQPRSSCSSTDRKRDDGRRRSSPTTPLSWSVDSSSELPQPSDRFRSKISGSTETATTSGKRRPRKKTFAELKDEESSLLRERTHLKKELAALQLTLAQQRSINSYLKKRKLDLSMESRANLEANLTEPKEQTTNQYGPLETTSTSNVSRQVKCEQTPGQPHSCSTELKGVTSQEHSFVLPDLNMIPDEDCIQEGIAVMG